MVDKVIQTREGNCHLKRMRVPAGKSLVKGLVQKDESRGRWTVTGC